MKDDLSDQRALSRIKDAKDRARPGMKSCTSACRVSTCIIPAHWLSPYLCSASSILPIIFMGVVRSEKMI